MAMDTSKTRIWRGGLAAITQGRGHDEPKPLLQGDLRATRIMPIENLLPATPAQSEPDTERVLQAIARPQRRRWPLVVAGALTLCVVVSLQVLQLRERVAQPHAVSATASEPTAVATADGLAPSTRAPAAQPAPAQKPKPNPVERSRLERAAVGAVIAGDYARAAQIYRELREIDSNPAFSSAARILDARKTAP